MWHVFGHHIQQCCMRACAAAIGIHGDGLFIASIFSLPRQFKLQNGERAKSWISESTQSLFEQIALLLFKTLRGMAPMYLQDLLQVKTPGRYCTRFLTPAWCKTSGDRAFAVAVSRFWDSHPLAIRERVCFLRILVPDP